MRKNREYNTKQLILDRSVELINESGIVDFRIDDLASSLSLSPGNITYHFARKEELFNTIWRMFYDEVDSLDIFITKIIDIKQFFLYLKAVVGLTYKYRGIVMFYSSNIRMIYEGRERAYSVEQLLVSQLNRIIDYLADNAFVVEPADTSFRERSISIAQKVIQMWQNREILTGVESVVEVSINNNSLLSLFCFKLLFTKKASEQFAELKGAVKGDLV